MVRPISQFCCGCPLTFGVKLIIFLHLAQSIFYIVTSFCNIVLKLPTFNFNLNLSTQVFNAAFCLMGIPFIFSAIWGVANRLETHLRLYLFYLAVSFCLDLVYIVVFFVVEDTCSNLPPALAQHGSAFACGSMRIFSVVFILMTTIVEGYFIFTVWSLCEDLKAGGAGTGLPQLLKGPGAPLAGLTTALTTSSGYNSFVGQNGGYSYPHSSFATHPGFGGSSGIFGGNHHETMYPPLPLAAGRSMH